ncbi:hypothetical protein BKH43_02610 [Helicobacter sp. 13S00401-1]|uniref:FlaG family protein n=1 Tax=Helicobacter sp. 13S00401-1 TaxID=1905758 RepID=UPI000BA75E4A|nr:FlaG family protein [Helicobacter sp. 13S00401-1]PAF51116.1 hypothetical protein BKH43_02610 [Helicobacter sp. 13S00401-1]
MQVQGSNITLQHKLMQMASSAGEEIKPNAPRVAPNMPLGKSGISEEDDNKLKEQLTSLSHELNKEMKQVNTSINFTYNDDIKGLVVTVEEAGDKKIIREIPSKEAIELMKRMRDVIGSIFDKKA